MCPARTMMKRFRFAPCKHCHLAGHGVSCAHRFDMEHMEQCVGGHLPGCMFNLERFGAECRAYDEKQVAAIAALACAANRSEMS
jgi:hypothetical protein